MKSLNVVLFIAAIAVTIPQTNAFGDTHEAPENWHYVNAINTHSYVHSRESVFKLLFFCVHHQ